MNTDIPDLIAGAIGVSRGTAYDLMREALAEQPAQQELAESCDVPPLGWHCTRPAGHEGPCAAVANDDRELVSRAMKRLAEQPAQQQEPVYWQWRRKDQPWSLEYTFNSEVQVTTKDSERRALYTSPPANANAGKPWVGLTEFDIDQIPYSCSNADSRLIAYAIEAKLKEKNT